jgi:hypothetical protein
MRRFTPPAASPAIDNCGRKIWQIEGIGEPQRLAAGGKAFSSEVGSGSREETRQNKNPELRF